MQVTLLPGRSRQAEQLQRALEGRLPARSASATVGGYAEVAARLAVLVPTTALRPSPEYRAELHERLVALALARAGTLTPRETPVAAVEEETDRRRRRAWFAPRWARTLTAATGAVLALTVGVGFASAGAVPGGLLYPVKQLIQSAQVQLARGDLSRGQTWLDQAGDHINDASTLVSRGSPDPSDVDTALTAADNDLADAQRTLLAYYNRSHDPAALTALATFATDQSAELTALRSRVPVVSVPLIDRLLTRLGGVASSVKTAAAQCGSACANVPVSTLPGPDGLTGTAATGLSGSSGSGLGSLLGPGGLGGLGGAGGSGGGTGAGSGAVSAGTGGVGVNLPGLGATVPAPGVSVGSGGAHVTVPPVGVSAGPVSATLPGIGISLPPVLPPHTSSHSTAPSASSSSSSICVLVICLGG